MTKTSEKRANCFDLHIMKTEVKLVLELSGSRASNIHSLVFKMESN